MCLGHGILFVQFITLIVSIIINGKLTLEKPNIDEHICT